MDYFALLEQPRRPWLDADSVKVKFLALSAAAHPDRAGSEAEKEAATQRFAELNAAYTCLREPKERLAHLVELETGRRPGDFAETTQSFADLFFAIAPVFQAVDKFLAERARVTSPLAKAQMFAAGLESSDKLMQLQAQIQLRRETLEAELRDMDASWPTAPSPELAAKLCGQFSFLKRWSEQIQERLSRLTMD